MKYALLIIFVVVAFGGAFAVRGVRRESAEPSIAGARSAGELYAKNCASCHGRDGRARTLKGKMKHARDLTDSEWQGRVGDERIFNSIMNGKGKMPPYGKKLSEQEIDSLVTYVRGLKR